MKRKQLIRINESQLRQIVTESVKRILREEDFQKPSNWKDTPFKGTFEDEEGALYMPDEYESGDEMDDSYDYSDDFYDEELEKKLTERYPEYVQEVLEDPEKVYYYWVVDGDGEDEVIYSPECFETEDEAADDCDREMGGMNFSGYVESLGSENGKIISDTMLCNEGGDFWMD